MKKILFVTGTDTGVGKTVLTAMLLAFLRGGRARALALKPFCSGPRSDARLLHGLQKECLTLDDVNPFYFDRPLAPAAAVSSKGKSVPLTGVLGKINAAARRCDLLVVEGVGGLMVPLGPKYTVRNIIRRLDCKTVVVCPNKLGVINHTLLTTEAMQNVGIKDFTIVLMGVKKPDISAASNPRMIRRELSSTPVICLPYLGHQASKVTNVKKNAKYLKKTLAQVLGADIVSLFFRQD